MPLLIKACLNGSREAGAHPALPVTPAQLAVAAQSAQQAGANAVHVHPRGADGGQSLEATDVAAALVAVRTVCPGLPLGVTTIATAERDVERRLALVQSWKERPDFASVNLSEPGASSLCTALFAMGIGVEAGLATPADARLLVELGLADRCLRLLIEVAGQAQAALETAGQIEQVLDDAGTQSPRLLHGFGSGAWAVLEAALTRGYDVRIGLEDTLLLPDGATARDNAELVAAARTAAVRIGRLPGA